MKIREAFAELEKIDSKMVLLNHINAVLEWDAETIMKEKASEERGKQMSYISHQIHELLSDSKIESLLEILKDEDIKDFSTRDKALVREVRKNNKDMKKIPLDLTMQLTESQNRCQSKWFETRSTGDWKAFEPYLSEVFDLVKEKAEYLKEDKDVYDTLLDMFESGMTASKIEVLFSDMEKSIHKIMDFTQGTEIDDSFLYKKYSNEKIKKFSKRILKDMGFDYSRGLTGIATHPFTSTLGRNDIRITSRFTDPNVADCLFSYIHEGGHALYEMGANNKVTKDTSLAEGTSMGFHESQSRLWENIIGHSADFWEFYFPEFKELFPSQLEGISLEQFLKALNKITPTDIRVNADEVTYSLHIILRFRLERELFSGNLLIKDLPQAWEEMSLKVLGRKPKDINSGVLQDIHWPAGMFGYFPSYAIGNLYNSQIYNTMNKTMDISSLLKNGNLKPIKDYLDTNIYQYGAIYKAEELIKRVTGEPLKVDYFDQYLVNRYKGLYK
ncbi:MAG: carboxypeptidase M32 [Sphaerochaetaceae bacterium]